MFNKLQTGIVLTAGLAALAGCAGQQADNLDEDQGFALRTGAGLCGIDGFEFVFDFDADGDLATNGYEHTNYTSGTSSIDDIGDVTDLDLPANASTAEGTFGISDYFEAGLPAGEWQVTIYPEDSNGDPAAGPLYDHAGNIISGPPHTQTLTFTIVEGQTTEAAAIFQCPGDTIGAADIVVLVNEGPSITGATNPDKFTTACEEGCFTADFSDQDGEVVDIAWGAYYDADGDGAPDDIDGPAGAPDGAIDSYDEVGPAMSPTADSFTGPTGTSESCWTCPDEGTYLIQVTATDEQGMETTFTMPRHCHEPAVGYCDAGWTSDTSHNTGTTAVSIANGVDTYTERHFDKATLGMELDFAAFDFVNDATLELAQLETYTDPAGVVGNVHGDLILDHPDGSQTVYKLANIDSRPQALDFKYDADLGYYTEARGKFSLALIDGNTGDRLFETAEYVELNGLQVVNNDIYGKGLRVQDAKFLAFGAPAETASGSVDAYRKADADAAGSYIGAMSCLEEDLVDLDATCMEALFETVPSCRELYATCQ